MIVICLIVLKPFEALEPTACVFLNILVYCFLYVFLKFDWFTPPLCVQSIAY